MVQAIQSSSNPIKRIIKMLQFSTEEHAMILNYYNCIPIIRAAIRKIFNYKKMAITFKRDILKFVSNCE